MTNNEFIRGVLRTAPVDHDVIRERAEKTNLISVLEWVASSACEDLKALDKVKKWMFYGKQMIGHTHPSSVLDARVRNFQSDEIDLIHSIIGIATEAGELLEALLARIDGPDALSFDRTNLAEEFGDILWYLGLGTAALGESFEHLQEMNQKKLRARFPEKFSEDAAINRDVAAERKLLESMFPGTRELVEES